MNCEDHSILRLLAYEILFTGLFTILQFCSQHPHSEKACNGNGLRISMPCGGLSKNAAKQAAVDKFLTDS
jgi:hypothetical protein